MLSRVFQATRNVFQPPFVAIDTVHSSEATNQIQTELAEAARKGKIISREQPCGLLGEDTLNRSSKSSETSSIRRQPVDNNLGKNSTQLTPEASIIIRSSKLGSIEQKATHTEEESIYDSVQGPSSVPLPTELSKAVTAHSTMPSSAPYNIHSYEPSASREKQKIKLSTGTPASDSRANSVMAPQSLAGLNGTLSTGTNVGKPTHKRFRSEEPDLVETPTLGTNGHSGSRELTEERDKTPDMEDEEPETMTASAGLNQSRTATADTARAMERQKATARTKRREHDKLLKEQAKSATKRKTYDTTRVRDINLEVLETPQIPNADRKHGVMSELSAKLSNKSPLPILLPDELLATEPTIEPSPTQSNALIHKPPATRKRKFSEDPKAPRDIRRHGVTVRVLVDENKNLPARASKASKMLKESWLAGRRGPGGGAFAKRRSANSGFTRK